MFFVLYVDWGTGSCFFFHKHENVKYITVKLICTHKSAHYVRSQSQNLVSLVVPLSSLGLWAFSGQFKLHINLQRLQVICKCSGISDALWG